MLQRFMQVNRKTHLWQLKSTHLQLFLQQGSQEQLTEFYKHPRKTSDFSVITSRDAALVFPNTYFIQFPLQKFPFLFNLQFLGLTACSHRVVCLCSDNSKHKLNHPPPWPKLVPSKYSCKLNRKEVSISKTSVKQQFINMQCT